MIIQEQNENTDFYCFTFDDNSKCSVGKQTETNPDGVASYEEAIENLLLNFPDLVI
jgi:hypothetical protein